MVVLPNLRQNGYASPEPSLGVDALPVDAPPCVICALVLVHAEPAVGRVDEAGLALAHVRAGGVAAAAVEADAGVLKAFVWQRKYMI